MNERVPGADQIQVDAPAEKVPEASPFWLFTIVGFSLAALAFAVVAAKRSSK